LREFERANRPLIVKAYTGLRKGSAGGPRPFDARAWALLLAFVSAAAIFSAVRVKS